MERNCRFVPLSRQPLVLVLCQVKYSSIRKIADYIPAIQEDFRRQGYPIDRFGKIQQVNIGPNGVQTTEQERWEFRNKAETQSIIVLQDSAVIQTTAYETFENFAKDIRMAASTILSRTEHDKFGVIQRVGLRYINIVTPRKGEDFRYYLQPGFHGLTDQVFKNGTGRLRVECVGKTEIDETTGTMVVRIAQNDQGMDLPVDLLGSAPNREPHIEKGQLVTFIDLDHYIEGKFDPNVDWIEKNLYLLHDLIIETFHNDVITKKAVEVWQ